MAIEKKHEINALGLF